MTAPTGFASDYLVLIECPAGTDWNAVRAQAERLGLSPYLGGQTLPPCAWCAPRTLGATCADVALLLRVDFRRLCEARVFVVEVADSACQLPP